MRRRKVFSLVGFCFFAAVSVLQVESCETDKLPKCLNLVTTLPPTKFIYTKEEIQHTCKVIKEFIVCMRNTGCDALPQVATVVEILQNTADHLCDDRFDEYLKHEKCLNSENVVKSADFCTTEATAPDYSDCKNKSSMLSCYVRSVTRCCGSEAGNFTDGLLKIILQTPNDCQVQSDLDGPTSQFCSTLSTVSSSCSHIFVFSIAFVLSFSIILCYILY